MLVLVLLAPGRADAIGSWEGEGELSLEATGALRMTGAVVRFRDAPGLLPEDDVDALAGTVARLLLEGGLSARVEYKANLFFELSRGPSTLAGGLLSTAGSFASPYRNSYLVWDFWDSGSVAGRMGVDRLSVEIDLEPLSLSIGRMPLNYSVTHILTPNDLFAPFSAAAINKVYKPGVDALRANYALSPLASVELAAVLGSDADGVPRWSQAALVARASAVAWEIQWAALGGKLAQRWFVGATLQGELGPLGVRAEGHVAFPDADADGTLDEHREVQVSVAGGVDKSFEWRNFNVALEAMYLSTGASGSQGYVERLGRRLPDELPYMGRLYLGLSVSGEILPILRGVVLGLVNTQDGSGLAMASLAYSLADEADLALGMLLPWGALPDSAAAALATGNLESEFGYVPLTVFLETRVFF
ncbi:MAG: hypothetical protein JRI68_29875 [Deltaproteobacteria bacterium]|nr:hypothetical protein [Deltaproteobacteria bacterium]